MKIKINEDVKLFMLENDIDRNILKPYFKRLKEFPRMYKPIEHSRYEARSFTCKNLTFAYYIKNDIINIVDVKFSKSNINFKI